MTYVADMSWEDEAPPAERAKLQRLRDKRDLAKDEYNAYRRKVKNRIDQARWRLSKKSARDTQERD